VVRWNFLFAVIEPRSSALIIRCCNSPSFSLDGGLIYGNFYHTVSHCATPRLHISRNLACTDESDIFVKTLNQYLRKKLRAACILRSINIDAADALSLFLCPLETQDSSISIFFYYGRFITPHPPSVNLLISIQCLYQYGLTVSNFGAQSPIQT